MNNFTYLDSNERQQFIHQLDISYGPIEDSIVSCLENILAKSFADYRDLSVIRVDLRFTQVEPQPDMPIYFQQTDPHVITRFIASLKSQLSEQERRKRKEGLRIYPCRLRYLWVLEQDKAPLPHYHLILFLNKGAYAFLGQVQGNQSTGLVRLIQEAWCRALGLPHDTHFALVHVPRNALTHLSREDVLARSKCYLDWLHRAGYLAKQVTKLTGQGRRTFGASQG